MTEILIQIEEEGMSQQVNCYHIDRREHVCANCKHFHQNYTKVKQTNIFKQLFIPVNSGFCVFPRIKDRKPSDTCEKWEDKTNE